MENAVYLLRFEVIRLPLYNTRTLDSYVNPLSINRGLIFLWLLSAVKMIKRDVDDIIDYSNCQILLCSLIVLYN